MCGIFAVVNHPEAARLTSLGLFALQHRGQESTGICTLDENGAMRSFRGRGLVSTVFDDAALNTLPGNYALGHVRYSTAGGAASANFQPLTTRIAGAPFALAHNGNISNAQELTRNLEHEGAVFSGNADSEIFLHLMARRSEPQILQRLKNALNQVSGAYALAILTNTELIALSDPHGYRPLCVGKLPNGAWVICSESCALDMVGAEHQFDVFGGECVRIQLATGALERMQFTPQLTRHCAFENIYFARPDSQLWGHAVDTVRTQLGAALAQETAVDADVVMGIPDSGLTHALGFSQQSGIPYAMGLIRNHYVGRTFIEPKGRQLRVRMKLNPVRAAVKGKRIIVVDDSLVRGTTSRNLMELLRDAGAKEIHLRLGSPPVKFPCFYGIDTPTHKELLAHNCSQEDMRSFLGVDTLGFLSIAALQKVTQNTACTSCFDGIYADPAAQQQGARCHNKECNHCFGRQP